MIQGSGFPAPPPPQWYGQAVVVVKLGSYRLGLGCWARALLGCPAGLARPKLLGLGYWAVALLGGMSLMSRN